MYLGMLRSCCSDGDQECVWTCSVHVTKMVDGNVSGYVYILLKCFSPKKKTFENIHIEVVP